MNRGTRQRLDALRRLAADPGATEAEKENARRRIAEHEEKYGSDPRRSNASGDRFYVGNVRESDDGSFTVDFGYRPPSSSWDAFWAAAVGFGDAVRNASRQTADFHRAASEAASGFGVPPFHYNARCHTVDPEGNFRGTRLSDFAMYVLDRWEKHSARPGPFGKAGHVMTAPPWDDSAKFSWLCPSCGSKVEYSVGWKEAGYARKEPAAMDEILRRLFAIWDGYSDNRCARCARHTHVDPVVGGETPSKRDADWFLEDHERRRAKRQPGPFGWVGEVGHLYDVVAAATLFGWACPECGHLVSFRIKDKTMWKAEGNRRFRNNLSRRLADYLDGYEDNRCRRCKNRAAEQRRGNGAGSSNRSGRE